MNAEAFHHRKAARQRAVAHHPHQHVCGFGGQRNEVPERIVRRGGLRDFVVRLGLHRMDKVGKLDRVLDEEHRHVVADEIPDPFVRIKFDGKTAHVARRIGRAPRTRNGREAHKYRSLLGRVAEHPGHGEIREILVDLKIAVRRSASRMHDPLRNALVVEMGDLFAEVKILEQSRPTLASFQRILIVAERQALVGGQHVPRRDRLRLQRFRLGGLGPRRLLVSVSGLTRGARLRRRGH